MRTVLFTYLLLLVAFSSYQCTTKTTPTPSEAPFSWENATVYFLLTDRFNNGDIGNDINYDRTEDVAPLRKFMGGDIKGIIEKIEDGYFTDLGVNAIWLTPVVEQVHGSVDEGQGPTYGYHGYWAKDWTAMEPNFGSKEDFAKLVESAHAKGIRILLDVVINQIGPATDTDPAWSEDWVRTSPRCVYEDFESTVPCMLTDNLPDIRTDSDQEVELPKVLLEKWEKEGRLEKETAELDAFFERTGYPRAPRFYIIKWLTDFIRKYGIDGFRVDTVKHVEATVWGELWEEALAAYEDWKTANPDKVVDDREFYMVGEAYGYGIQSKELYHYPDTSVNYFEQGFQSLINFSFKADAHKPYEKLFSQYSTYLHDSLNGKWVMNYISSHDDAGPFDRQRAQALDAGTKLLLTPGTVQIYYGDESARSLEMEGEVHDADLRGFMNWDEIANDSSTQQTLEHWQKLGQFRRNHPAVGMGVHAMISKSPYTFTRTVEKDGMNDKVLIALDLPDTEVSIPVGNTFENGVKVRDYYTGEIYIISDEAIDIVAKNGIALIEKVN